MVQDPEVGLKRSSTLTFTVNYKMLMVMVEVNLGLRPFSLPLIIQMCLVYH